MLVQVYEHAFIVGIIVLTTVVVPIVFFCLFSKGFSCRTLTHYRELEMV